ncbi:MAG: T9SS type A sorting domain-containing protein [Saprospiraceae bacterium]
MKKTYLLLTLLFLGAYVLDAQTKEDFHPCGTLHGKSDWLKRYQQQPQQLKYRSGSDTLFVPLTMHIVGSDDGAGYFPLPRVMDAICQLNEDFAESKIQFFVEGEFRYLPSGAYNNHTTVLEGAEMMFTNNVAQTINCYIVDFAAGNCGYNLPYAGVCLAEGCIGEGDHTWAHEIGHNLTLPHPFLGWEGGISYDGSEPANYFEPAPTQVLYDYTYFQDTLIVDTLIIDTALVELVDGSNCSIAADGFCDTPPDYLAFRWNCDGNNQSPTNQIDPNGVTFKSDGSLFMSYAFDVCSSRFSDEQISAMRANLVDEKADYLNHESPKPLVSNTPLTVVSPALGASVQYDAAQLDWESIPGATHYVVQISQVPNFGFLLVDEVVGESAITVNNLVNGITYYWRVRPFNNFSFCTTMMDAGNFKAAQVLSANDLEGVNAVRVYPNTIPQGTVINVELSLSKSMQVDFKIFSLSGQRLQTQPRQLATGTQTVTLSVGDLAAGMYLLSIENAEGKIVEKILIH